MRRGIGEEDPAPDYDDGRLKVAPRAYIAYADGSVIPLPVMQLALLAEFTRYPDRVRTRSELRTAVWGEDDPQALRSVDTAVARLRAILSAAIPDRAYIHTHPKVGYRFSSELR